MNKNKLLLIIIPIVVIVIILIVAYYLYDKKEDNNSLDEYWKLERVYSLVNGEKIHEEEIDNSVLHFDGSVVNVKRSFNEIETKSYYYNMEEVYLCWSNDYDKAKTMEKRDCYEYEIVGDVLSIVDRIRSNVSEIYVYRKTTEEIYESIK